MTSNRGIEAMAAYYLISHKEYLIQGSWSNVLARLVGEDTFGITLQRVPKDRSTWDLYLGDLKYFLKDVVTVKTDTSKYVPEGFVINNEDKA